MKEYTFSGYWKNLQVITICEKLELESILTISNFCDNI